MTKTLMQLQLLLDSNNMSKKGSKISADVHLISRFKCEMSFCRLIFGLTANALRTYSICLIH